MNGLKTVTIGSLGNVVTGSTPSKKDKNNYGDYALWIKPTDINENEKYTRFTEEMFSKKSAEQCKSRIVPKDSICVPCIGTIGTKLTMTPCDCFVNQSINAIVPNEDFDNHYVYYLLRNFLPSLKSHNKGTASGREFIAKTAFEEIEIKVFEDKQIQQKIGLILSEYDNLIDNYRRQIKLLEEAAQRLYKEWFVDLRFPGYEHTKIVDGVPEGWKYGYITDISECFDNKRKPLSSTERDRQQKKFPYYGAASLMDYVEHYIYDGIYLLFSEDGTVITTDGTPVLQYVWGKFWVNNHAHVFQGIAPYSTEFLYMLCKHMKVTDIVTGVAQPKISRGRLNKKNILIPTEKLVHKYSVIVESWFCKLRTLKKENDLLIEARDRLLPKLMSGEIKV